MQKLFERFEKCESELCRVTVLRTFANAGIDMSIYKLETIIKSRQHSQQIRVEAIFALRMLVTQMPRKVQHCHAFVVYTTTLTNRLRSFSCRSS